MALLALPASAQEAEAPDEGASLIEEGARMLFEGLMQQTEPALEELRQMAEKFGPQLRGFAEEMGPALAEILKDVEDLSVYEAPEQLPNGDIIIRRKEPLPKDAPEGPLEDAPMPEGEIEI
ncbi:hypothetical protein [Roseovarius aquimarinus]|uniref:AAA+ family ATPase n=1 Tax=Roseovarius aquimarinus TaxID=1229156 RepID=A0ABW7I4S8_9RHOB